jgi:caffeoyl-CoA O-methyltransferase
MADNDSRSGGARYTTPELLAFVQTTHAPHDAALARAFDAPDRHDMPAIQVGPSEGKTLNLLLRLIGATKVVEVGTLAGYSALHMARGLKAGGHLWTIEADPKHAAVARDNLAAAGLLERVTIVIGPALDVLPALEKNGPFDAVFLDADKGNYDQYGRWAARNVRPGGLLIGDNAYFFGALMSDTPDAAGMRRFHQEAALAFDTVCLPTPDGLLVGIRR